MANRKLKTMAQTITNKDINVRSLCPNAVTMTALAFGVSSINMSLWGKWEYAMIFIFLSMIFDFLDGKVARMMGVSSRFGAELDSLSDFVSFGVAPGVLMYLWSAKENVCYDVVATRAEVVGVYWIFALFLAMCCATRLARFNSLLDEKQPAYWTHFFMGVPAPAGGGLAMFPLILHLATGWDWVRNPTFVGFFLLFSGVMMASRIPTLSLKHLHIPRTIGAVLLLIGLLFLAGLLVRPWATLALFGIGYLISIPLCVFYFFRFKRRANA